MNTQEYVGIIEFLQANDLMDAIGMQTSISGIAALTNKSDFNHFVQPNLPGYAAEPDIGGLNDEMHSAWSQNSFPSYWEDPAVASVALREFLKGLMCGETGAFLMDENSVERPPPWRNFVPVLPKPDSVKII